MSKSFYHMLNQTKTAIKHEIFSKKLDRRDDIPLTSLNTVKIRRFTIVFHWFEKILVRFRLVNTKSVHRYAYRRWIRSVIYDFFLQLPEVIFPHYNLINLLLQWCRSDLSVFKTLRSQCWTNGQIIMVCDNFSYHIP